MALNNQGIKTSGKKGLVCVGNIENSDGSDWGTRDEVCPDVIIAPDPPVVKGLIKAKSGLAFDMDDAGENWLLPDMPILRAKDGSELPIIVENGLCYVDIAAIGPGGAAAVIRNLCLNEDFVLNEDCMYELSFTADCFDRRNAQQRIDQEFLIQDQQVVDSGKSDPLVVCNEGKKDAFVQCSLDFSQFIRHLDPGFSAVTWSTTTYIGTVTNTETGAATSAATGDFNQTQSRFRNASILLAPGECVDVCYSVEYTHIGGEAVQIGNVRTVIGCNVYGIDACEDVGPIVEGEG